jgi:hypothetical protein
VAAGTDDVVITSAGGLIVSDSAAVVEAEALSVTLTVKLADPAAVGLPEIVPPGDIFSPAGSDPLTIDQEYGGEPPDAASACEYPIRTVPTGSDDVVITSAGGLIVSDNAVVAEAEALSVTLTVTLADPAAVGLPEIVPPGDKLSPSGSDPFASDHE